MIVFFGTNYPIRTDVDHPYHPVIICDDEVWYWLEKTIIRTQTTM